METYTNRLFYYSLFFLLLCQISFCTRRTYEYDSFSDLSKWVKEDAASTTAISSGALSLANDGFLIFSEARFQRSGKWNIAYDYTSGTDCGLNIYISEYLPRPFGTGWSKINFTDSQAVSSRHLFHLDFDAEPRVSSITSETWHLALNATIGTCTIDNLEVYPALFPPCGGTSCFVTGGITDLTVTASFTSPVNYGSNGTLTVTPTYTGATQDVIICISSEPLIFTYTGCAFIADSACFICALIPSGTPIDFVASWLAPGWATTFDLKVYANLTAGDSDPTDNFFSTSAPAFIETFPTCTGACCTDSYAATQLGDVYFGVGGTRYSTWSCYDGANLRELCPVVNALKDLKFVVGLEGDLTPFARRDEAESLKENIKDLKKRMLRLHKKVTK